MSQVNIVAGDDLQKKKDEIRKVADSKINESKAHDDSLVKARSVLDAARMELEAGKKKEVANSPSFWTALAIIKLPAPGDYQEWCEYLFKLGFGKREINAYVKNHHPKKTHIAPATSDPTGQFCVEDGVIKRLDPITGWVEVCNFEARIVEDIIEDDDIEPRREYVIQGKVRGETTIRRGTVRADDWMKPQWIEKIFGGGAYVNPRENEYLRAAIKALSVNRKEAKIVSCTGWRDEGEGPEFFHAGGSIGAKGLIARDVRLDDGLSLYNLPEPLKGDALQRAFHVFQELRRVEKEEVTAPLIGSALTAPTDTPDFSTFAIGETGAGKTTYTLLILSLYGKQMVEGKAPAEWEGSTAYGLQVKAHKAKNLPLHIDEYVPRTSRDGAKLTAIVTAVLRKQGNRSGRTAGRADGGLRAEFCPRGSIIGTGEDVPPGESVRARMVIVQFTERMDTKDKTDLSKMQAQARKGVFAGLMSAYLSWLAQDDRIGHLATNRADQINRLREGWIERLKGAKVHPRTASNFAALERGWIGFYDFAVASGLLSADERNAALAEVNAGLLVCAKSQALWQMSSNPVKRFVNLVSVALASGKAHLSAAQNYDWIESERRSLGWRTDANRDWIAHGEMIGFVDEKGFYIFPASASRVISAYSANGEGIALTERQLNTQLKTAGVIIPDSKRKTATIRRKMDGTTHEVLFFKKETILDGIVSNEGDENGVDSAEETDIDGY